MHIAQAREVDLVEITGIERECFSMPWSYEAIRASFENCACRFYCAWIGGVMAGYCSFVFSMETAQIMSISTRPAFRRRGIGNAMMVCMLEQAKSLGCTEVFLEVRKSNEAAQKLYENLGFYAIGLRKGYYTDNNEDAIVLKYDH